MLKTFDMGLDWVTTTIEKNNPQYAQAWRLYKRTYIRALREGHKAKRWNFEGYHGWWAGDVGIGTRKKDVICMVSGNAAHGFAVRLAEAVDRPKISRLDVQVTAQGTDDADVFIRELYNRLDESGCKGPQKKEMSMRLWRGPKSGWSVEFQSRKGDKNGRIYNKTKEQKGLVQPFLIRFEGEFKRAVARAIFMDWKARGCSRKFCADFVATWFDERGVDMGWTDRANAISCPSTYTRTTLEKKMNWIEKHVAKTAREINARGFEDWQAEQMGFSRARMPLEHDRVPMAYQEPDPGQPDYFQEWHDWYDMREERKNMQIAEGNAAAALVK